VSETTGDQRLAAIEKLVRTIVDLDLPGVPAAERDVLIQHLTGALFVYGEQPYALPFQGEPAREADADLAWYDGLERVERDQGADE
jgi:hypothetical protein